jgi:hypothetical protein
MKIHDIDVQEIGDVTPGLVPRVAFDVQIGRPRGDMYGLFGHHPQSIQEFFNGPSRIPVSRSDLHALAALVRNAARRSVPHDARPVVRKSSVRSVSTMSGFIR